MGLSIIQSINISIDRSLNLSIDRSNSQSINLSIYQSINLSIYLSIDLSTIINKELIKHARCLTINYVNRFINYLNPISGQPTLDPPTYPKYLISKKQINSSHRLTNSSVKLCYLSHLYNSSICLNSLSNSALSALS